MEFLRAEYPADFLHHYLHLLCPPPLYVLLKVVQAEQGCVGFGDALLPQFVYFGDIDGLEFNEVESLDIGYLVDECEYCLDVVDFETMLGNGLGLLQSHTYAAQLSPKCHHLLLTQVQIPSYTSLGLIMCSLYSL